MNDIIYFNTVITYKYVLNEQGFAKVPGMHEYGLEILDIDILESVSFPWQLRHGFQIIDLCVGGSICVGGDN